MPLFSNHNPSLIGVYDNELSVSYFPPGNEGKVIGRDTLKNVHHSGGSPERHPTLTNVIRNTAGHVYIAGTFRIEFVWPAGDVTEREMDDYIDLIDSYKVPKGYFDVSKDFENNMIVVDMTQPNPPVTEWSSYLVPWLPAAPKVSLYNTSQDSEFICVTRLNGTYNDYTFDHRTIEVGDTLRVDRPKSSVCYVIFTQDVMGSKRLISKKAYKLSSDEISITNDGTERVSVLRYYKA
jgi:hypothetical protein